MHNDDWFKQFPHQVAVDSEELLQRIVYRFGTVSGFLPFTTSLTHSICEFKKPN